MIDMRRPWTNVPWMFRPPGAVETVNCENPEGSLIPETGWSSDVIAPDGTPTVHDDTLPSRRIRTHALLAVSICGVGAITTRLHPPNIAAEPRSRITRSPRRTDTFVMILYVYLIISRFARISVNTESFDASSAASVQFAKGHAQVCQFAFYLVKAGNAEILASEKLSLGL